MIPLPKPILELRGYIEECGFLLNAENQHDICYLLIFYNNEVVFWADWSEEKGFGVDSEDTVSFGITRAEFKSKDPWEITKWVYKKYFGFEL